MYQWTSDHSQVVIEVTIEECEQYPNVFRVIDNDYGLFNTSPIIHCENPQKVYIEDYECYQGQIWSHVCEENGWDGNHYGTLNNNIATIPADAFGTYKNGGWYVVNSQPCQLTFPENYSFGGDPSIASGLYFGITAFNYLPEIKPMKRISLDNKQDYKEFVNSRTTDDYTFLYYSAEQALKALKGTSYPMDLSNAALITFTDGNDDGSLIVAPDNSWDDIAYRNYIEELIADAYIQGIKVDAYSIGLKGIDIGDYNYDMFKSNLRALATEPKDKNATEVDNMIQVENTLNSILDNLETSWLNKKVSCNINMRATGDKIRFTLDKSREEMNNNPENSDLWIEGVFSRDDNSMNDVVYHGCTSSSGSKVVSKTVEIEGRTKYQFTFENLKDLNGNHLTTGEINFWHATSSNPIWQPHTEFGQGSDAVTEVERSSAAIMFVMDCSTSLGDDFKELKRVVNTLIDRLVPGPGDSGVQEIICDPDSPVEYYTLQGIKVAHPSSGIYIVKKGKVAKKVLL